MLTLVIAALLAAQEVDCATDQTQAAMNQCAYLDFERADRALNIAYRARIAAERTTDRETDRTYDQRPGGEQVLREAQRAWVTFRDAHCTLEGYESRGGSMEPLSYNSCRARLTEERTRQLAGPADR